MWGARTTGVRPYRFAGALVLACALIAVLAGPAAAAKHPRHAQGAKAGHARRGVPKMIWGPITLPNGRSAFPIYHRLGVNVYQTELLWAQVAPTRPAHPTNPHDPAYQWPADLDAVMSQAARYHIKVCLLVQQTPGWANGGRSTSWTPTHPGDYANFLVAAARRYPAVHLWMIWGEPTRPDNFDPMPANSPAGPRAYAKLLNAAYHSLKRTSRANKVIGGDTWSFGTIHPAQFIRWMRLPNGKPPPLDYYGHNPFSVRFPSFNNPPYPGGARDISNINVLERQLVHTYHRPVKLWLSEFTISSDHTNRAFDWFVSRRQQAKWVTAAFNLVNSVNYVAGLGWYDLADENPAAGNGRYALTTGLMTWNLKPKPAFYAYQHAR